MFFRASSAEERKSVLTIIATSNELAVFKKRPGKIRMKNAAAS